MYACLLACQSLLCISLGKNLSLEMGRALAIGFKTKPSKRKKKKVY